MSLMNPYLKQYKKNQVETATPEQILILLYDGAINFLNKAKLCLDEKDYPEFHKNMIRCKNIIAEFMQSLDLEQGGDWAVSLYNLYKYLRKVTLKADRTKDLDKIDEVLKHLTSLRNTWQKAIDIAIEERKQMAESSGALVNTYGDSYKQKETETTTYYDENNNYLKEEDNVEDTEDVEEEDYEEEEEEEEEV